MSRVTRPKRGRPLDVSGRSLASEGMNEGMKKAKLFRLEHMRQVGVTKSFTVTLLSDVLGPDG